MIWKRQCAVQERVAEPWQGLARLPQTSFLELQEVAEDAELAVTRMPRLETCSWLAGGEDWTKI